ncbi:MAG: (d)CMP kinase [Bacteroidales bacterium]|nr:(d)CMP kinase [Bacteroidales bacterium]
MKKIIIAIDGYSSTGKSSFAKLIAKKYGLTYLDSGAMYRGVTLHAIEKGFITPSAEIDFDALKESLKGLDIHFEVAQDGSSQTYMGPRNIDREIRSLQVANLVSPIATVGFVRDYVNDLLHLFGIAGGIVMDGRDIGTTVYPNADLKIFMTASAEVRAERRFKEMKAKGENPTMAEVLDNIKTRDHIDSTREVSPLTQAPDAIVLDNSYMTFEQQMEWVDEKIKAL